MTCLISLSFGGITLQVQQLEVLAKARTLACSFLGYVTVFVMLFQLLPVSFEPPTLFLLQQLSGMLKGIFEKAGSFFFLQLAMLVDALCSAKPGKSLPDLLPQGFQALFLCWCCLLQFLWRSRCLRTRRSIASSLLPFSLWVVPWLKVISPNLSLQTWYKKSPIWLSLDSNPRSDSSSLDQVNIQHLPCLCLAWFRLLDFTPFYWVLRLCLCPLWD